MYFCADLLVVKILLQQYGITGCNSFSIQPLFGKCFIFSHGNTKPASSKAKFFQYLNFFLFFINNIFPGYSNVRHSVFHILRYIIIAQKIKTGLPSKNMG